MQVIRDTLDLHGYQQAFCRSAYVGDCGALSQGLSYTKTRPKSLNSCRLPIVGAWIWTARLEAGCKGGRNMALTKLIGSVGAPSFPALCERGTLLAFLGFGTGRSRN
jgi:hypothetical protein